MALIGFSTEKYRERAAAVGCPTCGAKAGEWCWALGIGNLGSERRPDVVHSERVTAAAEAEELRGGR